MNVTAHRPVSTPTALPAWNTLQSLADRGLPHLRELLACPADRPAPVAADGTGIRLDFTRQAVNGAVMAQLQALAQQAGVAQQRDAMFAGAHLNTTEDRAVLHVALRGAPDTVGPWGAAVHANVQAELARVCAFADALRSGQLKGHTGETLTDVVNIGIGGSDLGPRMATEALAHLAAPSAGTPTKPVAGPPQDRLAPLGGPGLAGSGGINPTVHYVSNPDAWALHSVLRRLNPARTLVVVSSKTFTTQETLTNAASARRWLANGGIATEHQGKHLVAITAAPQRSAAAGYLPEHTFTFWDWVGGRYSVWSALGLPLALAIGSTAFREFLAGGHAMDEHFRTAPPESNLPVLMGLLGVWNRNFLGCPTQLLSTYPSRLARFAPFVQQMDMESNGKRTHLDGTACTVDTGPIVWGGLGIDGQHAYFQLLHQGQHRVPVEFVGVESEDVALADLPFAAEHHRVVNLNLRAQAEALAQGRGEADTLASLLASGLTESQAQALVAHRSFPGNVPNSTLWLDALTPSRLGALIALYEHKVFVQAAIWGINAYDQWGVELGKTMAQAMEKSAR